MVWILIKTVCHGSQCIHSPFYKWGLRNTQKIKLFINYSYRSEYNKSRFPPRRLKCFHSAKLLYLFLSPVSDIMPSSMDTSWFIHSVVEKFNQVPTWVQLHCCTTHGIDLEALILFSRYLWSSMGKTDR